MSFMVVNTGRVASQYFYINLKLQPNIFMPSRYQFDYITKSFIKRRYHNPLKKLVMLKKTTIVYKFSGDLKFLQLQNLNDKSIMIFSRN